MELGDRELVYCPSYAMLVFALGAMPLSRIAVVTTNRDISEFCGQADIPCVQMRQNDDTSLSGMHRYRNYVRLFASAIQGQRVTFSAYLFDIWGLYLMHRLAQSNHVTFINLEPQHHRLRRPLAGQLLFSHGRRIFTKLAVFRIVTRLKLDVFRRRSSLPDLMIGMSPARLIRRFPPDADSMVYRSSQFRQNAQEIGCRQRLPQLDILFVDDNDSLGTYSMEAVSVVLDELAQRGLVVAVKPHPLTASRRFPGIEVPSWIPAEIMAVRARCGVVGVYSSALNGCVDLSTTVSLLHLAAVRDSRMIVFFKRDILRADIQCPRSFDELLRILGIDGSHTSGQAPQVRQNGLTEN